MHEISLFLCANTGPQLGSGVGVNGIIFRMLRQITIVIMASVLIHAADSADEHASHHPPDAGSAMPAQIPTGQMSTGGMPGGAPGPAAGMMAQMGDMMKGMGTTQKKEIYPSLMDLPVLTQEKRREVAQQATQRMSVGAMLMGQGLDALTVAEASENFAAMHQAMNTLREGTAQFESGIAARRALAEGRVPREVALEWFKREMNLSYSVSAESDDLLNRPSFHYFVIAILATFAVAMVAMYYVKMKRAHVLLARLTGGDAPAVAVVKNDTTASLKNAMPSTSIKESDSAVGFTMPPSRGWKGILRVNRIFHETPGVKTYRLTAQDGGPLPFTYLPGQYLIISPMLEGKRTPRSYTMASSPTQTHYCELTIKREEDGKGVSKYVHDGLQEGELIEASGPIGQFTFTGAEAKHVVLIGGGVGITPLMSYIRFLTDRGWPGDIFLLYTCRHVSDYIFRSELEALSTRHPKLHLVVTITRPNNEPWDGLTGRLTKDIITNSVPDIATRLVYICGPDAMMRSAQGALLELGVPAGQVKTEAFSTPQGVQGGEALLSDLSPVPSEAQPRQGVNPIIPPKGNDDDSSAHSVPRTGANSASIPEGVHVTFQKSGKLARLAANVSILEAAESVGVAIDFECRVGTCGRCKVNLLSGAVTMDVEDALSSSEKSNGVILACQAKSTRNCTVDA